jgi:two-component system NarL family sensor kinase
MRPQWLEMAPVGESTVAPEESSSSRAVWPRPPHRRAHALRGSGGASSVVLGGKPVSVARLVYRFSLAGLLAMFLVALGTGIVSRQVGTRQAIDNARQVARLTGEGIVQPALTDGLVNRDPTSVAKVDEVIRRQLLRSTLVRVKIWRADGTVVYSDDRRLRGQKFDLGEEERAVLQNGGIEAEVSDVSRRENRFDPKNTKLLEVYLPLRTPNKTPLLYETYFRYSGVTEAGRNAWLNFAVPTLGALLLLELIQIPLAVSLARRVRDSHAERENLLRRAVEASDTERRRIASDLHDGIVQDLTGVSFALTAEARKRTDHRDEVISGSAGQVRDSITSLRSLLVDIYPPNLQEEGLESALGDLLAKPRQRGVNGTLEVDLDDLLDPATASLLYRAAQEAIRNVVRHSAASNVRIHLGRDGDRVTLTVDDDGRGFDPQELAEATDDGHVGLRLLAGLIADASGEMEVYSAPGAGTAVTVSLPLS